jgi:signal transduction histidine kinase
MENLHASREELVRSQAKAGLAALVASVSHELSTPIGNSVLVASSLGDMARQLQNQIDTNQLKKSGLLQHNKALAEGCQMLMQNLARAETLLKDFKQVSADQASEQRRQFDLAEVVAEVVSSLAPSLKTLGHRVEQDIPEGIRMDSLPGPMGQVIINLINNAYHHAFEGRHDGVLTISARVHASNVHLQVSDNGAGMPADVLLNLFEPFFSTKIGRGGTGLGMSIVDSIVRKTLGGSIAVRSVVGEGTTYDMVLPLRAPVLYGEA